MLDKKTQIKEGITFHQIETNKFKTNLMAVFLSLPLDRETATKNAMIGAVLRRGTKKLTSQEEISKNLEEMYGANFDCGIEKTGDYHTLKFYLELLNNQFLPIADEDLSKRGLELLLDIVFNPYTENDSFKKEYVEQEKENLKQIIEGKIDNKGMYAFERCIEEMYKDKPYGIYKFGYVEDLSKINEKDLYEYYKDVINSCKIDIFVSGDNIKETVKIVSDNENIQKLQARKVNLKQENDKEEKEKPKEVQESMDVTQGKLVIGLDIIDRNKELNCDEIDYIAMVYNTILGVGANSKLFRNVREKASLAYTCGSNYIKRKQNVILRAGIEIKNYERAMKLIQEQLDEMKNGDFTDEDMQNAKNLIYATIDSIEEEQDTEISYYFGQELSQKLVTVEEYKKKIETVNKDEVIKIANSLKANTIYFLKD